MEKPLLLACSYNDFEIVNLLIAYANENNIILDLNENLYGN